VQLAQNAKRSLAQCVKPQLIREIALQMNSCKRFWSWLRRQVGSAVQVAKQWLALLLAAIA